jgi:hypothetical protein
MIARHLIGAILLASLSGVVGIAAFMPAPAEAQVSRCDQIADRERRQRCRSATYQAEAYREEERSWREAEEDIRGHHKRGCRRVGRVGGRGFRLVCDAPRVINDWR